MVRYESSPRDIHFHTGIIDTISNRANLYAGAQDHPDDAAFAAQSAYDELAWPADRRWRPVVAIVGGVVALGSIATAVIINSGDSATTKATVGAPTPRTVISVPPIPAPSSATPPNTTPSRSQTPLPQETPTTVPTSKTPASSGPTAVPTTALPPASPPPALNPRTIAYTVTGTKQLLDVVSVAYTDQRGFLVTEFNVPLPWRKAVVLNPGVQTESVIATSLYSHLNCSITNAAGQPVIVATRNSNITTCTR